MSTIKAVIFDLGNVLLFFDWNLAAEKMSARTGRTRRELMDYLYATPFVNQFELGQLSREQFFQIVAKDLGFDGDEAEFAEIWSDIFSPNEPMLALAQALKGRCPRYILSNTIPLHIDFILAHFPVMHEFDGYVFSYEAGLMKPDPRIYELTLRKFGLTAGSAVFIDDLPANVDVARSVGLPAIRHVSNEQTFQELTKLGIGPI